MLHVLTHPVEASLRACARYVSLNSQGLLSPSLDPEALIVIFLEARILASRLAGPWVGKDYTG
jgi:hypothetical protein